MVSGADSKDRGSGASFLGPEMLGVGCELILQQHCTGELSGQALLIMVTRNQTASQGIVKVIGYLSKSA